MQLSYLYQLFVAYIFLSATAPQLGCSGFIVSDHKQDSQLYQTTAMCWRNCALATRSPIKAVESRQSCYQECLLRFVNLPFGGNTQETSLQLYKRNKRDVIENPRQVVDKQGEECRNATGNVDRVPSEKINITFSQDGSEKIYANVSWDPLPSKTAHWTGYKMTYYTDPDWDLSPPSVKCRDLEKNATFSIIEISIKELNTTKARIYVMITSIPRFNRTPANYDYKVKRIPISTPKPDSDTDQTTAMPTSADYDTDQTTAMPTSADHNTNQATAMPTSTGTHESIFIIVAVLVVLVLSVSIVALFNRRRCLVQRTNQPNCATTDSGFKYDAFIIYSTVDQKWVTKELLPTLEKKHNIKCCIHYRDFALGVPFTQNMADSVYNSKKTVAVVSKNFLSSTYCSHELNIALHRLAERGDDSVIVIKLDDIKNSQLPKELRFRSYIDFTKSTDKKTWECKLINCFQREKP